MQKTILMLLLAVVSSSAMAEWVYIGQTEKEELLLTTYADSDTIRKEGNTIKMWILHDFNTLRLNFISARIKEEYDCKEKKQRILFIAFYTGHMGGGETVAIITDPEDQFKPTAQGSLVEAVLKFACGFRTELP